MATLNVKSSFSISINGKTIEGWQGTSATADADDNFAVTVDGNANYQPVTIADAAALTLYDNDDDQPVLFDYLFFCATQDVDLQIIAATLNVILPVKAGIPFVLGHDEILAAINTTAIVADATPSYEAIDSIRVNNRSGSSAVCVFFTVD